MKDRFDSSGIADRARNLIAQHPHFRGRTDAFEFQCTGNVLVIRGCVPMFYLKQLLQNELKHLPDVHRIDNRVDVFSYEGTTSLCS
jgi:hypothetical protein